MVVRIRFRSSGPGAIARSTALLLSALMTPVALMAWALGAWRLAADMGWASGFAIGEGPFSRWQVWMALAVAIQFASFALHRAAGGDTDDAIAGS